MNIPNLNSIKGLVKIGRSFVLAHRPEMLLGASVVATVGSTVLGAKGGYESGRKIERLEMEREINGDEPMTIKEKTQETWKNYVPAGLAMTTALGSTAGLHFVHVKDKKALVATALSAMDELKEQANDYVNSVSDAVGEELTDEQKEKIRDKVLGIQADRYEDGHARVMNTDGIIEELYLVRDPITGRDIWSNRVRIEQAMLEVGNVINGSENADLNMFYNFAGWADTKNGGKVGWSGVIPEISWVDGSGPIGGVRDDGRPYVSFRFRPEPTEGFDTGS